MDCHQAAVNDDILQRQQVLKTQIGYLGTTCPLACFMVDQTKKNLS
jgi:hypothetical protein